MKKQLPNRKDVDLKYTWDFTHLFKSEDEYQQAFDQIENDVQEFSITYENKLTKKELISNA